MAVSAFWHETCLNYRQATHMNNHLLNIPGLQRITIPMIAGKGEKEPGNDGMREKFIKKSFDTLHQELQEQLTGKKQGHVVSIPVGEGLFPESLPPRLEIVLLDPQEMFVAFRMVSDSRGINQKKSEWNVGPSSSAAEKIVAWVDQMLSVKKGKNSYEVQYV
jgi:hypothetical protein